MSAASKALAALLAICLLNVSSFANDKDQPEKKPAEKKSAAAKAPRVAVVNFGVVFTRYDKAMDLKKGLEAELAPLKEQAEELKTKIEKAMKRAEAKTTTEAVKETLAEQIREHQNALQGLDKKARKEIGKKQEMQLVMLWREIKTAVADVAKSKDLDVVFGYGDPADGDPDSPQNVNRKMQGMDAGSAVPIYTRPGVDITDEVLRRLNDAYREASRTRPAPDER
jgi:Skp family chaperone for outer membrane proteins